MRARQEFILDLVALAASALVLMIAGQPGWIMLAAAGGVLATRGWVRLAVSILTILIALAFVLAGFAEASALVVAGAALAAIAGGWAVFRGKRWPALGPRYEAGPKRELSDWDALDAGIDPTDRLTD